MKLFISLSTGQTIPSAILESIARQDMNIDIVPCCTEGIFQSNHGNCEDRVGKLTGELKSRNLAVELFNKFYHDESFVAMQDRDILHLSEDNFDLCISFLEQNQNYDAVALPWKDYIVTEHIRNAAFVIRGNIFKDFKFRIDHRNHICLTMQEDIKICFLPSDKKLIQEIL